MDQKLKWPERVGYGIGGVYRGIIIALLSSYLMMYLTNVAMLDIAVISTILGVSRIFDGISDVVIGNIIDNTSSRHGKARVWILRISLPLAVSFFLLFLIPEHWPDAVRYIYVFLIYNVANTFCFTFAMISQYSLLALITEDKGERGKLSNMLGFFYQLTQMLVRAFFVKLLIVFSRDPQNPNTKEAYSGVMAVLCVFMFAACLIEFFTTKERVQDTKRTAGDDTVRNKKSFFSDLGLLLHNKYWCFMLFASLIVFSGNVLNSSAMSYYTLYVLKDFQAMTMFGLVIGISGIVTTLFLSFVDINIGKTRMYILVHILMGLATLGYYFAVSHRVLLYPALILRGISGGAATPATIALVAETITYAEHKTGKLLAGLGSAGSQAMEKLGMGLATVLFGAMMAASGFDASLDAQGIPQPDSVLTTINMTFSVIPAACFLIVSIVFIIWFDLDKKMKEFTKTQ